MEYEDAVVESNTKIYVGTIFHLSSEQLASIGEYIISQQVCGTGTTISTIRSYIRETFNLDINHGTMLHIIHRIGYMFGSADIVSSIKNNKQDRIREYILEYSLALKEEKNGECLIVYMDESYVNTRHALNSTWYHPDHPMGNKVIRGSGKGNRLIIIHAISKEGLLHYNPTSESAIGTQLTAEMIWEPTISSGDYHKNINGSIFIDWIDNKLLLIFEHLYSSKKLILILDNASFHR